MWQCSSCGGGGGGGVLIFLFLLHLSKNGQVLAFSLSSSNIDHIETCEICGKVSHLLYTWNSCPSSLLRNTSLRISIS